MTPEIKLNKMHYPNLEINFNQVDFDIIVIIIEDKKYTFPAWEFRQKLIQNYEEKE